jgi:hypothetical protein
MFKHLIGLAHCPPILVKTMLAGLELSINTSSATSREYYSLRTL